MAKDWNIFARELQSILEIHGFRLGQLDDRANIHPQKVARLKRSLIEPHFYVLTPDELEVVARIFVFTEVERLRLRAAVLVTAIEEMLMDRINQDDALKASEDILPIIYNILAIHKDEQVGLGTIKADEESATLLAELEPGMHFFEHGAIQWHHADAAQHTSQKAFYLREAAESFRQALSSFETLDEVIKSSVEYQYWCQEIQIKLSMINRMCV
jgi:hypothetical protein